MSFSATLSTLLMIAIVSPGPTYQELRDCVGRCRARPIRSFTQFCLDELIIPEGKHEGEHFRPEVLPWTGLLLGAIDSGRWTRVGITGCVQGGKSLFGHAAPTVYHLFEAV